MAHRGGQGGLHRVGVAQQSGTCDLSDDRNRLPDRPHQVPQFQSRHRRRVPSGRSSDRPARHQGSASRQDDFLRPLSLHDGLQGGTAILSRSQRRRSSADGTHGSLVRDVSAHRVRVLEAPGIRRRDGCGPSRRRLLGIDRDRHGWRGDPAPPATGSGKGGAHQQYPRCLCRDLPDRHGRFGLVPPDDRTQAHAHQPPGGGGANALAGRGRR